MKFMMTEKTVLNLLASSISYAAFTTKYLQLGLLGQPHFFFQTQAAEILTLCYSKLGQL